MSRHEEEPKGPPLTDLRSISRSPKRCITRVNIAFDPWDNARHEWLIFGAAHLRHASDRKDGRFRLEGYLGGGVTDYEHSNALVVRLPLIGVQFDGLLVQNHHTWLIAWVDPDAEDEFHIPGPGYNPTKQPKAARCEMKECLKEDPKSHMMVPPGFYVPPFDPELYKLVRGKKVEIRIGPVFKEDDDD